MSTDTVTFTLAFFIFAAGFTGFYLGIKADAWMVRKCARLGIPYVNGEKVFKITLQREGDVGGKPE